MNPDENYSERLQHVDRNLLIIIGLLLTLAFLSFLNKTSLETEIFKKQRDKLNEFLSNHKIFDQYLKEKEQLYWELNKKAWISLLGDKYLESYSRYISIELFEGIGSWGWDEDRLENQFPYEAVIQDFFIEDFNYWTSRGERKLRAMLPSDTSKWADMHRRLKKIIKNDTTISSFFARLQENKAFFLKAILTKYRLPVSDKILKQIPDSMYVLRGNYLDGFVKFFNDSTRSSFGLITAFYGGSLIINKPQQIHDMHNWIFQEIFNIYVRDKFTCYDSAIYSNKLPYSAYVDKIKLEEGRLNLRLKDIPPSTVTPPAIPFEVDKVFFNLIILWIFAINIYLMKNLIMYRNMLENQQKLKQTTRNFLKNDATPTIINIFAMNFKNRNRVISWLIVFIQLFCIAIVAWVNISYENVLYENFAQFMIFFIIPVALIVWVVSQSTLIALRCTNKVKKIVV